MVHILLTILKIIGIILLVLLGIILTLLVLILFVPIRYRVHAGINERSTLQHLLERSPLITDEEKLDLLGELEVTADVTWLIKFVRVTVNFIKKKLNYKVKIACFQILSSEPKEKRRQKRVKPKPKKGSESGADISKKQESPLPAVSEEIKEEPKEEPISPPEKEKQPQTESLPQQETKPAEKGPKEAKPKKDISESIDKLSNKIQNVLDMINDEDNQALVIMALKSLKKLLWHIRPRSYYCYLYYGADDPSVTGKMMMAYGIAKGVLELEHLEITPDFERKVIKLSAQLEGRIRLIHVAVIACKIFFNKTFRKLIGGKKNGRQ